jgi:hypothetical protein
MGYTLSERHTASFLHSSPIAQGVMFRFYWPTISTEDKVVVLCILFIVMLWIIWAILSSTRLADKYQLVQFEAWLWRKHGVSVSGVFLTILIVILILYGVWLVLGTL